jgi:phosphopantothenoylcysteine decarboxylase/phosphopantothenate--cysteine ligase
MGHALARAAWRRGARVVLVSGPVALPDPEGVEVVGVRTARELLEAVRDRVGEARVVIHAAAVADYRPCDPSDTKLKRADVGEALELKLTANPDVALETRSLVADGAVVVGFALETGDLVPRARAKLEAKGFDLLVANDAAEPGAGFEIDTNRVTLLAADTEPEVLPVMSKDEVAEGVLDRVAALLAGDSTS